MRFSAIKDKEFYERLCDFACSHRKVYIYGAGNYGKLCFHFLQKKNIHVHGFITTSGRGDALGAPIYKAETILEHLQQDSGIILAIKHDYQEEVKRKYSFSCDELAISEKEYEYLQKFIYFESAIDTGKYPITKELLRCQWNTILVVQLEVTFGDLIWSTAFYRELRRNFENSHIVLIMNSKWMNLYRNCPYIDRIVPYECDTYQYISSAIEEKADKFIKEHFADIAFDVVFLPRLLPSVYKDIWENVFLALASGAKNRISHALYMQEKEKYMCDTMADWFTVVEKHTRATHEVIHDLDMLTACGCQYMDDSMELWLDDQDKAYASKVLADIPNNVLLVAVAMVGSFATKSWDPLKYGEVFSELSKKYHDRVRFLLCGGMDASDAATMIPEEQKRNCINITGKTTLTEAAAIISECDIYLGSDTGLMHMASVFNIPIVEISASNKNTPDYWVSSPVRMGPWKVNSVVLRPEKGLEGCEYSCVRPYAHCINQITPYQVGQAIEKVLDMKR